MNTHHSGWRKSTHSAPDGHCVEAGRTSDGKVSVRDTKLQGNGPILKFSKEEWRNLLDNIRTDSL
ncbi:DUF397 domain-containing protein [Actinomadura bangladeshensis]|uniref:DUF397 domain-containing protein n=1 Tax=Actinomadura bangladeshensis TaxID=453573 RepID=A0A4R4NEA2_9ACTN|nr:DUF397 domain-containing protein [Actinomadura bangladeshensis]TDC05820.1 DUF397 domain-containing protein [Actinomadura bangladeshensis]